VYEKLRALNPSPYLYHMKMNQKTIIGASPEMLIRVTGDQVETFPIAGTRKITENEEKNDEMQKELINDEKELAEHVMLLDLGRNDIGKVSKPGTVEITQKLEIEKYSHVMHIVSHVTGELSEQFDSFDALKSGFPAGTVSGAPKIRAMQLIAEHEPNKRGPYSGAIGYFSYTGNMDTAISLRTMILKDGIAYLQAGGGIVADSNPEKEFEETLHKMAPLMRAIEHTENS